MMNVFQWLTGRFSNRNKALSLYRHGMERAKQRDHQGAIGDYTTVISMTDAPNDVKAMALYNRALVHIAVGHHRKGADDLDAVLASDNAPVNVKTTAREKLVRMNFRSRDRSTETF